MKNKTENRCTDASVQAFCTGVLYSRLKSCTEISCTGGPVDILLYKRPVQTVLLQRLCTYGFLYTAVCTGLYRTSCTEGLYSACTGRLYRVVSVQDVLYRVFSVQA